MKILLIIFLFLALFKMPYWFYQSLRIFGTIGFFYLAWKENSEQNKLTSIGYVIVAILLNPILKITFRRETWHLIDIFLAVAILSSLVFDIIIQKISKK